MMMNNEHKLSVSAITTGMTLLSPAIDTMRDHYGDTNAIAALFMATWSVAKATGLPHASVREIFSAAEDMADAAKAESLAAKLEQAEEARS